MAFIRFILCAVTGVLLALHHAHAVESPILHFGDLLQHPIGPHGLEITQKAKSIHGQNVRLRGYMVKSEEDSIGQFYFAPLPIQLSEHADGPANDLPASAVLVKLDPSQAKWAISHKAGALVLEGILRIERHEDAQGTVSWFQLQLPVH